MVKTTSLFYIELHIILSSQLLSSFANRPKQAQSKSKGY
jgi:hypothetical protein